MNNGNLIILGSYRPIDSFLHRLDARSKVLPVLTVMILALFSQSFLFHISLIVLLLAALVGAGVGVVSLARNYRPILLLVMITALYHLIFSTAVSPVLISIFGWEITVEALNRAGFFSLRLLLFVSVAFVVTLTNSPSELAEAISRGLRPLKILRVPVNDLGLILFIALRFIPVLCQEFLNIKNAQAIRGVRFDGNFLVRIRRSMALLVPVFVSAIARADDLAMAIEARGYDGSVDRTNYGLRSMGAGEYLFMFGGTALTIFLFVITQYLWPSGI